MKRVIAAMTAALLMVALVSSAAVAAPPNKYGQQCYKNGWQTVVGTTGTFSSQSACVAYVNKGGKLYPKTASLTSVVTGPVTGLGALVGNPQSRTAGGITDPAMLFTLGGLTWVPGVAISLTYTAAYPLGPYPVANPTLYFPTAPAATASGTGTLSTWFQDNCFDVDNTLISGNVSYTITGTNVDGQSASVTHNLNCNAIPATILATANAVVDPGWINITTTGWHWSASAPMTLTYSVFGTDDGLNQPINTYFTVPNSGADGSFAFNSTPYGDNCIYGVGGNPDTLQTTDFPFTMTASDGTHSATATGVLQCSLLAP